MTRLPLDEWLPHLEAQPHPEAGRYSQLSDAALWRLHAVHSGRVGEVEPTDLAATAAFVGVSADELTGHLITRAAASPSPSGAEPESRVARRWLEQRARLWAALSLMPMNDEFDRYEARVRALLDQLQVELGAAVEALEGVGPSLLGQAPSLHRDEQAAQSVERGLNALAAAQEALVSLRRRMIL